MREISNWQKNLLTLSSSFRDYERLSFQSREDSTVYDSNAEDFEEIRTKVKEVSRAVRAEDEKRKLQTLLPTKSDKVKYPSFGGEPGEDLVKFKEKMLDCFKKNRVPESDQLDKIRENLNGAALKRVPQTVKKASVAWQNLSEAFGSPMLVLKERLKSLSKLGTIPPDCNAGKQITWYHDFESVVQDIIDLGTNGDMNMQMGAFGPQVQEQVLKALNDNPQKKREVAMSGHLKQPRDKIVAYRDKIISYRRETQLAEVESGTVSEKKTPKNPASGNSANYTAPDPARNDDCRICKQIQDDNNPKKLVLFDRHLGVFPIHCPNFMKMKMKDRFKMVQNSKMCIYCLHHEVVTDRSHETTCKGKVSKFSKNWKCDSPGCGKHSWICVTHADNSNKKKLKYTAEKLLRKGFEFALPGILAFPAANSEKVNTALEELEKQINKELVPAPDGQPMFLFFGAKGKTRKLMVFFDSGCSRFIMRECVPGKELPASLVRRGPFPIGGVGDSTIFADDEYMVAMDTDDGKAQQVQGVTVKTITSKFPDIDITSAVSEVTLAAPQNRPLQRCKFPTSVGGEIDWLMGIQYNNLQPKLLHMLPSGLAVYKTKLSPHQKGYNFVLGGPHSNFDTMLARTGNGTYMMEQFIDGLASWRNLGPPSLTQYIMSELEVTEATKKNFGDDDMSNYRELVEYEQQELTMLCNEMLGGVSIIMPESSPEDISEAVPDSLPAEVSIGVPLIFTSSSGKNGASRFTSSTGKNEAFRSNSSSVLESDQALPGTDGLNTLCDTCGIGVSQEDFSLFEDEKLSRLKKILELQESSLDISYRCVRCRECLDCKNAEQVEKISLREESELYEIKNSVHLDWEEKKITCTLPLRGIERDFLTSNEDRALRILDSQCRKYFKDEETKASIVAAFQKLIDKGYIQFIDDLPADLQKSFLNKEVQYYLPWRIQFKPESASTSVRPVFDASSRTRKRRDGTGGRCLNDLVCKGPTNSLDLLKVTLRFLIGPIAFAADLTKMYNQFNLKPEQWNLQKLLFRE